jgi:hypothetical protein
LYPSIKMVGIGYPDTSPTILILTIAIPSPIRMN